MSTAPTSECSEQEIATLSKQLSHSMSTHKIYYEQKKAKEDFESISQTSE